jgi:hypothetical protein
VVVRAAVCTMAVHAAVCGSRDSAALCGTVRHCAAVCGSAAVRQYEGQRVAVCSSVRQWARQWAAVRQCSSAVSAAVGVAVRAAVCGSVAMCGSAEVHTAVRVAVCRKVPQCAAGCGSVRQFAAGCGRAVVRGNATMRQRVQQCGSVRQCTREYVVVRVAVCVCLRLIFMSFMFNILLNLS